MRGREINLTADEFSRFAKNNLDVVAPIKLGRGLRDQIDENLRKHSKKDLLKLLCQ